MACHAATFAELGGVPAQLLYDRMKTVVVGEPEPGEIVYHPTLLALAAHYGFRPKACRPYRAKTKGKVVCSISACSGVTCSASRRSPVRLRLND